MVKKSGLIILVLFFLSSYGYAALSKHIVDYRIKAKLLTEEKAVEGQETLTWLNDSSIPVSELQFHLYLNAFKNNRSTFMRESGGTHRGFELDEDEWGFIDIKSFKIKYGPDLTSTIEYIQPDDGNEEDRTVMRIVLPEPVPPDQRIILDIEFFAKLPRVFARSGFYDDFYMIAQWFPKIGVFQDGQWNCHQYHANSEFFADFGIFEVEITVPEEYIVGSTGKRIKESSGGDGIKTYTYYQEDVHDFAWTACPDFVEFKEKYTLDDPRVNTEIILLVHRSHLNLKERYLSSLKNGLEFYSRNYGAYPYETITLVDPPIKASGAGGMEYPTLFTTMGFSFLPEGIYLPEMVTIHEFGHGYWYGIVASNEFEEPWLDEGINSYSEAKAMAKYYGEEGSMINWAGIKLSDILLQRFQVAAVSKLDPILKKSWEFYSGGSYGVNSYQKASITLLTLENYLGEEVMAEVTRTYYDRWKFKHPKTQDFFDVAEEVSGEDLGWFFSQFFKSPDTLDYAVGTLSSREIKPPIGIFNGELKTEENGDSRDNKVYENEVTIVRKGELYFPQEILITFEDGQEIRETWDGKNRWVRYTYTKPQKLKSVQIDPDNRIILDIDHLNNYKVYKPKKDFSIKTALGCMFNFQNLLSLFSF